MMQVRTLLDKRGGMLLHLVGGVTVFFIWRLLGMPAPGTLGRLIPLSWLITGLLYGKGGISRHTALILLIFAILSLMWAASPVMQVLASTAGFLGLFPGLLSISRKRAGILRALIPVIPILLIIPFGGDEPHYATLTEDLVSPGTGAFGSMHYRVGDPSESMSHHQGLFPALMVPGYPFGVAGMRGMNIIFALAAVLILSGLYRRSGIPQWNYLSVLGFLLLPGSSILGGVFPGWAAMMIFLFAVLKADTRRRTIWIVLASVLLVLLKFRFAGISIGLLAIVFFKARSGIKYRLLMLFIGLLVAGLAADHFLLGGSIFWVKYGNSEFLRTLIVHPVMRLPEILVAFGSSLVDIESGLLWKAPWVLAGLAGLPVLRRKHPDLFIWLGVPALFYYLFLIYWKINGWAGLPAASGRTLLPLMPVLLASAGCMLKNISVRYLLWASLGIAAVYFTYPYLRFNFSDGTDMLVSTISGQNSIITEYLPSSVRLNLPVFLMWLGFTGFIVWMLRRNWRFTSAALVIPFLVLAISSGGIRTSWEAEDIPSRMLNYCRMYPEGKELGNRNLWMFSREKMLLMSSMEDEVVIPAISSGGDTLEVIVYFRALRTDSLPGIRITRGEYSDSIYAASEIMDAPGWVNFIMERRMVPLPENLSEIRAEFLLYPDPAETVRISPLAVDDSYGGGSGIYLDRIEFR